MSKNAYETQQKTRKNNDFSLLNFIIRRVGISKILEIPHNKAICER